MCEHCGNEFGFVFETCIECGYNRLSKDFERIVISVSALRKVLPPQEVAFLVGMHADNTKREEKDGKA